MLNQKFVKQAIQSDTVRGVIVNHYNDIITDEKQQLQANNKSIALKIAQSRVEAREYFAVN